MPRRMVSTGLNGQLVAHEAGHGPRYIFAGGISEASVQLPIFTDEEWRDLASHLGLSGRESDVAQAVALDSKDVAIALQLRISVRTVRTHFERLYRKLGVSSRVGLLLFLLRTSRQLSNLRGPLSASELKYRAQPSD